MSSDENQNFWIVVYVPSYYFASVSDVESLSNECHQKKVQSIIFYEGVEYQCNECDYKAIKLNKFWKHQ